MFSFSFRSFIWRIIARFFPVFEVSSGKVGEEETFWFEGIAVSRLRTAVLGYRPSATPYLTCWGDVRCVPDRERWGRPIIQVCPESLSLLGGAVIDAQRFFGWASGQPLPEEEGFLAEATVKMAKHRPSGCFIAKISYDSPYVCGETEEVQVFWHLSELLDRCSLLPGFRPSAELQERLEGV